MDLWIRIACFTVTFSLFDFFLRVLCSPFLPFSSTNSEEAKSTTWLHPVTGEAVITGHRKTPGKQPGNRLLFSPCENTGAHAAPVKGYPRVTAVEEKKKRGGDKLWGEPWKAMRGRFLLSAAKQQPPLLRAPFGGSTLADRSARCPPPTAPPPHAPPGHFATHFLKVPSRRREPE